MLHVVVAVDAMGGDKAPQVPVAGAIEAARQGVGILLVGDEAVLEKTLVQHGDIPDHHYCGETRADGSSYCEKHRQLSIRDFEEEPRQTFVPRKRAA